MKAIWTVAIALAIATPALAQQQQQIPAPTLFSIRSGETLTLLVFSSTTNDCVPTFIGFNGIDILDGPPEITLKFEALDPWFPDVSGRRQHDGRQAL